MNVLRGRVLLNVDRQAALSVGQAPWDGTPLALSQMTHRYSPFA